MAFLAIVLISLVALFGRGMQLQRGQVGNRRRDRNYLSTRRLEQLAAILRLIVVVLNDHDVVAG